MSDDKVNIGLSIEATRVAEILENTNLFIDKLTIAKFALSYAIKNNLDSDLGEVKTGEVGGTKWNIGSVDNDKYLKEVIVSLYPEIVTPYRQIEALMNSGLLCIGKFIEENGLSRISDLM